MILYFADRKMNILGQASTSLPEGVIISNDRKTEEVDEGVAILEFDLEYDPECRKKAETLSKNHCDGIQRMSSNRFIERWYILQSSNYCPME